MAKTEKLSVKQICEAIKGTGGIKTAVAKKLNVHRQTIDRYEANYLTIRAALQEELNKVIDKAESNLFIKINEGDEDTSKWFLSRKGKNRGYSEKQEVEQSGEVKTILEVRYEEDKTSEKE